MALHVVELFFIIIVIIVVIVFFFFISWSFPSRLPHPLLRLARLTKLTR